MTEAADLACQQLGWYVRNCVRSPMARKLEAICLGRLNCLKGVADDDDDAPIFATAGRRKRQVRDLQQVLRTYAVQVRTDDSLEENAVFARDEFGLDTIDTDILLLLLRRDANKDLQSFAEEITDQLGSASRAIAALVGIDPHEAQHRLMSGSGLVGGGILTVDDDGLPKIAPPLRKIMHQPYGSRRAWAAAIFGPPLETSLGWEDFAHLASGRDLGARLLEGAARHKAKGINLLLHGPVGTGKTEFCKVLAAKLGMSIWSVGESDDLGDEPSREERLASFRLAQRLLAKHSNVLILFDEAEDLLAEPGSVVGQFSRRSRDESKVYINRLIERNAVPVLWTCNDVQDIDRAVLRRMMLAVEIKTPSQPVRARIWRRVLNEAAVELDNDAVRRLSQRYEAPPAVAANAARAAALTGGGEAEIEQAMGGILQILDIGPRVADTDDRDFDLGLVNCCENLVALVDRLACPGAGRTWSACLSGPPGTGKSQFARHLANRLGLEVMHRRASDLLSSWLGESEKQIAAAFAAARAQRAMLIIDEADSLLSDRRNAVRTWEVTQVNEMLTWMESHPLPFVCTTNLMDRLDQASLRRFTLKLRFDVLTAVQADRAFTRFFGMPAQQLLPDGLTVGDFATVRRKRDLLGNSDASLLADWLDEEVAAKGPRPTAIGFFPQRDRDITADRNTKNIGGDAK